MWFDFKQDPTQRTCYNSLGYGCEKFILLSFFLAFCLIFGAIAAYRESPKSLFHLFAFETSAFAVS